MQLHIELVLDGGDRTLIASLQNNSILTAQSLFAFSKHLFRCQVQFGENWGLNAIAISELFDLVFPIYELVN